jgi:hypothetical protein
VLEVTTLRGDPLAQRRRVADVPAARVGQRRTHVRTGGTWPTPHGTQSLLLFNEG